MTSPSLWDQCRYCNDIAYHCFIQYLHYSHQKQFENQKMCTLQFWKIPITISRLLNVQNHKRLVFNNKCWKIISSENISTLVNDARGCKFQACWEAMEIKEKLIKHSNWLLNCSYYIYIPANHRFYNSPST